MLFQNGTVVRWRMGVSAFFCVSYWILAELVPDWGWFETGTGRRGEGAGLTPSWLSETQNIFLGYVGLRLRSGAAWRFLGGRPRLSGERC